MGEAWRAGYPLVLTDRPLLSLPTDSPPESFTPGYAPHSGVDTSDGGGHTSALTTPLKSKEVRWGTALQYARGKRKTWQPFDPHSGSSGDPGSVSSHQDLLEDGLEDLLSLYPGSWGRQGKRRGGRRRGTHGRHKLRHGKRRRHHPHNLLLMEAGLSVAAGQDEGTTLTSPSSPSPSGPAHTDNESSAPSSSASSSPHPAWEHEAQPAVGKHTPTPVSVALFNAPPTFTSRPDDPPEKQQNSSMAFPSGAMGWLPERPSSAGPLEAPPTTAQSLNGPLDDFLQRSLASLRGPPAERPRWELDGEASTAAPQKEAVTHEPMRLVARRGGLEGSSQPLPPSYQYSLVETPDHSATQRLENSRHDLRESNKRQTIKLGSGARHTSPMSPEAQSTSAGAADALHKQTNITTPRPSTSAFPSTLAIDHVQGGQGKERPQELLYSHSIHHTPVEIPTADLRKAPALEAGLNGGAARLLPTEHSPSITILAKLATAGPDRFQALPVPDPPVEEEVRTSGGGCYSTNDVVMVVFLTSLANMVAFVVVTVALCWCSLRARAAAAPPRSTHPDDAHQDPADDDAEETA